MSVIVPRQLFDRWLAGENVALGPYPAGAMKVQPVSMLVNNPRMKSIDAPPGLAQRLPSASPRMSKATLVPANARAPNWHAVGDPTLADAILDRLVHNAYQLNLTGESMRKTHGPLNQTDHFTP